MAETRGGPLFGCSSLGRGKCRLKGPVIATMLDTIRGNSVAYRVAIAGVAQW